MQNTKTTIKASSFNYRCKVHQNVQNQKEVIIKVLALHIRVQPKRKRNIESALKDDVKKLIIYLHR